MWIDTDDVGVVECLGRAAPGQLVVKRAISSDEPLRKRPVHQENQYANKAEGDVAIAFLIVRFLQIGSCLCFYGQNYMELLSFVMR